ncbi:MAG: hypothetical protein ACYSU7_04865 [Planctomycetota bacterium]|jgi:hypothetical protein
MSSLSAIVVAALVWTGDQQAGPFQAAAVVPPDVRVYVHVRGAAEVRSELADRPIIEWVESWLDRGQLPEAWQRLADAAGTESSALFDLCLGRAMTVVFRGREDETEWAVLTEIDRQQSGALLERLSPLVLGPKHDMGVFHLPDQELLLARGESVLLIAPHERSGLFYELIPNLAKPPDKALAAEPIMDEARALGPGRAGVFVRHAQPMGGCSVAVADLDEDRVKLRHASRFESAPFSTDVTRLRWDPAPVRGLEETMAVGFIEPTDIIGGRLDAFMTAALGVPLVPAELGDNLGDRRITAISEIEGRLQDPPFDLLLPTVARVYEVKDAKAAWQQLDDHMVRLVGALNRFGQGAFRLEPPDPATFVPGEPRRVEIGPLAKWILGDLPGLDRVSLNWTVTVAAQAEVGGEAEGKVGGMVGGMVGGPGGWCVIASDPRHLEEVARALATTPATEPDAARWASCGTAHGPRLARQLGTWRQQARLLAAGPDAEALEDTLSLMAELAHGLDRCRWRLCRPSAERVHLEAELQLSPPASTRTTE